MGVALLSLALIHGSCASAHALPRGPAADVHGDDENDVYVGTGGLLLPSSVGSSTRAEVATCGGCTWRLTSPCIEPALGNPFDGQSACMSVVRGCPAGQRLLRAWFRPADQAWRESGLVCLGEGGPVTVEQIGRRARDRFVQGVPEPVVRFQPPAGMVTQLPVVFDSGQPAGTLTRSYRLMGEEVGLTATARWQWDFGDGSSLDTSDPGGPYPHQGVAHAYRTAGYRTVVLRTIWSAWYTVDGLGPFPVTEEIGQVSRLRIDVGEGRALLTPG